MIFRLHVCNEPTDPRRAAFASVDDFRRRAPEAVECTNQITMKNEVFQRWPGAVVMPIKINLGSGSPIVLGVLPSIRAPRDPDGTIPFVAFVRPEANDFDRAMKLPENPFDRDFWRTPTESAEGSYTVCNVEFRASDMMNPAILPLEMFLNRVGELVIAGDIGEGRVSFTFESVAALLWHANKARERETDATFPGEPTREEITEHVHRIVQAMMMGDEGAFIAAFSAYLTDVLAREPDALRKISMFVYGVMGGSSKGSSVH